MTNEIHYDMPAVQYHSDPCPAPSLSAGIIKPLLYQSPRHAWYGHPRLNKNHQPTNKKEFDIGTAAHALMLGDKENYLLINPADYPTKNGNVPNGWTNDAIREARDNAYAAGKTPLLPNQFNELARMVEAGKRQLAGHECAGAFDGGKPEVTLLWQEGAIWCRCRIDYWSKDNNFYDYKTTAVSANPDQVARMGFNMGWDIISAFYKRGIRKVLGIENPTYRFVVQEVDEPHALSVVAMDPMAEALAERKIEEAIRLWGECLSANTWPGYPSRICYIGAPAYQEAAWLEREALEETLDKPFIERTLNW